jgi:hypothetical protein
MEMIERTWTPAAAAAWARRLYDDAVDMKDAAGYAAAFVEDGWLRFGNNDPITGRANIEAEMSGTPLVRRGNVYVDLAPLFAP